MHFSIVLQSPLSLRHNAEVLRFRKGEGGLLSSTKVSEHNSGREDGCGGGWLECWNLN